MPLEPVAMTFGDGLRCSAILPDCWSNAVTTIGTDMRFRGPDFSMGFRFRIVAQGFPRRATINTPRHEFFVDRFTGSPWFDIWGILHPTSGSVTVHSVFGELNGIPEDGVEHSIAWTFDGDGSSIVYFDGVAVEMLPSPSVDLSTPAAPGDVFRISGTNLPSTGFDVDEVWFANEVLDAARILDIHTNGV
jgi:hypothetical protein